MLNSRQTPAFLGFFGSGFAWIAPLSASSSMGRFPFPAPGRWNGWGFSANISNGSPVELGPGRHETYGHGSQHVQAWSADAANSIRNCMSYSSQASWLDTLCWRRNTVCKCATMLGTISGDFFDSTAMYREKQRVHVIMSVTRLWALCCCIAWNWLNAPIRLSWREEDDYSCSAIRSERGAGRNSSMSTYSGFHTLSTSFMGSFGRPFSSRYLTGFASALLHGQLWQTFFFKVSYWLCLCLVFCLWGVR